MSRRQKLNDSYENLNVELEDKPNQKDNMHETIGSRAEKKSMKEQLELNWKFLQLHRKLGQIKHYFLKVCLRI